MNKQLIDLLTKYPDAKIYPFTNSEVVCDSCGHWLGNISKVYYGQWWEYEGEIFFSFEDLVDYMKDESGHKIFIHEGIIILIDSI